MPLSVSPVLQRMYQRSNPRVRHQVDLSRPDLSAVYRRIDQFTGAAKLSEVPAATLEADPAGALTLVRSSLTVADFHAVSANAVLKVPDPSKYFRGVLWTPDPAFPASIARTVTVKLHRTSTRPLTAALQIYKLKHTISGIKNPATGWNVETTFVPLLANPVSVHTSAGIWDGASNAEFTFDLSAARLPLRLSGAAGDIDYSELPGDLVNYFFVVECIDGSKDGELQWVIDSATARAVAGVGTFEDREFTNATPGTPSGWTGGIHLQVPYFKLAVEAVAPTSAAVYAMDLGAVPSAASTGRIIFEPATPVGASATLELSTGGAGGPFVLVHHGDVVATKQQTYHLRLTMHADAASRIASHIAGFGLEFRETVDASFESIVEPVVQAISVPFCEATIGQGSITVVRTGRRDYHDAGSDLVVRGAVSAIEADVQLMSDHPDVGRQDWLRITRAPVSDRAPTPTSERLTLLSILKQLQAKVPARVETLSAVATVVSANPTTVELDASVNGGLPLTGLQYYMRVRTSSQVGVESGFVQTIDASEEPGHTILLFGTALPGTLVAGDVIEVHSGRYAQPVLSWLNADLADIWWELLTVHRSIPAERIGRAGLGTASRSGLPPRVTDRAPGDAFTQSKLLVTLQLQEAADCDKLIDQISFLLGGATVEIAGQIVFRQIYPIRNIAGDIVIPAEPIAAIFDERTTIKLDSPVGLEQRITSLACNYGVDTTTKTDDTAPTKTTEYVDVDALAWLAEQDLHELGHATIPDEIARWCYNAVDGGLLIASLICQQVVRIASTGLRTWAWGSTEQLPNLVVGDRVVVVTDQYTDHDPARDVEIRGRWAFPLVLTGVEAGGRRFRGMVMGLNDAVQVRGGAGDLTPADGIDTTKSDISLNDYHAVDSADGLTRTITFVAGALVHRVLVFARQFAAQSAIDPWPPTDQTLLMAWFTAGGSLIVLTPDPVTRLITYVVTKPPRSQEIALQFDPRVNEWDDSEIRRLVVQPAESAMTGTIKGSVTNALVDLSANVQASLADWPVQVDFYADDPFGAAIASKTISANATLDKTAAGLAALGALTLPLREVRRFFGKLTNVAGEVIWMNPVSVDRDSLPWGLATLTDYTVAPTITVEYDDDTDTVEFFMPGGKTKTFAGLVGSGSVQYVAGVTARDDASLEAAFATEEIRGAYRVDITGGGVTVTIWGSGANGKLHGPVASAVPQATGSVDANGAFSWSEDGPASQDHVKYSESLSAYPSDASVISGGTTLAGRQVTRTGGTPLTLGQRLFVTIVSFDVGGNVVQSIHLQLAYQTSSVTRTTSFGPGSFVEKDDVLGGVPAHGFTINGSLNPAGNGVSDPQQEFGCIVIVADGATITNIFADVYSENDGSGGGGAQGHNTSIRFDRVSSTGGSTNLGTATAADNGGWQSLHLAPSEPTAGRKYNLRWLTSQGFSPSTPSHTRLAGFQLVTTIPDLTKAP